MFDCCLVSSLSPMVFYNILLPMFSAGRSPASLLLVCVPPRPTAAWLLLRSVVPYHSLFLLLLLRPRRQVRLLFLSTSLLSLGYPSPTPPSLFLTGYFDAQVSGFRYPSPAPPRLFLTGYFDAQVSLFRYPRAFFSLPVLVSLIVCFDALLFSHPTFPSRLLGWPARCLCRLAVRLRFLPLRGFYRSAFAVFFWGLCSSAALMLAAPQSSPTSGRLALCAALRFACDFYRSAVFTAPRFLPLRFRRFFFFGALLFRRPHACCPLVFTHFRAARSLCRLAVRLRFLPLCGFYRSAVFTAPRFLPLCGFYRSADFTAPLSPVFLGALLFRRPHACCPPVFTHFRAARSLCRLAVRLRFLPLRVFYRSAVFTAPLSPVFWGLCSSAALLLAAPQSSPSSGRTLWCRLVRSVSGGPPFLTLFLYRLLNRSRSVTAHLTGFPFVHFIHIRGPSIVSSFECRDTGTACTSTSLWNLTAHGNKAFSPQTDGSAVCRYAY